MLGIKSENDVYDLTFGSRGDFDLFISNSYIIILYYSIYIYIYIDMFILGILTNIRKIRDNYISNSIQTKIIEKI